MDKFNSWSTFTKREMGSAHNDPNVFHFSHPHPLECTTPPSTGNTVTCFGCKLKVKHDEEYYYHCKTCPFSLHHVCFNMPLITHNPSHPTHDLVLIVTTKSTIKCAACGYDVSGFSYHCAECNIFFHSLCLALPVSLEITNHPHEIKLEFSPPYDFFCDLCNKPSYQGWLYRCNMCEFDTHIACAVENLEPHLFQNTSFPQSSPLLSQLTSPQVEQHKRFGASVNDSCKGYEYEIMNLVAQQIGGGLKEDFNSGWDKRLYSTPRKNHLGSEKIMKIELQEKEPSHEAEFLSKLEEERTPLRDKWTPPSDLSNTPLSNQYSESYFSIDLTKPYSYSTNERRSQLRRESGNDQITPAVMAERVVRNCGQREEPFGVANWQRNYSYDPAQHDKLKAAFFNKEGRASEFGKTSQIIMTKSPDESNANSSLQDQTIVTSESVSSGGGELLDGFEQIIFN